MDPSAGQTLFRDYAEEWLRTRALDESTRESTERRVRGHLLPTFGDSQLAAIKPREIREWDRKMVGTLGDGTRAVVFAHLKSILNAAVDDEKIGKNPCLARSVIAPRPIQRKVIPWKAEIVSAIQAGIQKRYSPMVALGAGCGMRQGEILGISPDDVDFDGGWLHIVRQVKIVRDRLVFGLPKSDRDRRVPLPDSVAELLRTHIEEFPPVKVTLPWENPASNERVTVRLAFTTTRQSVINRNTFNAKSWHPALRSAGVTPSRSTGMHALRHFYASSLLDAGESIKALSEYLGHANPGFTLRYYTHLMPSSEGRTRKAIDDLFRSSENSDGPEGEPDGLATA
ncbi:site-specific integrase [Actinoplanes sp. NEAU-A12]|uniref:Site-specific integrase n=1 Tax=Actinoplanes sandaracinus TaxID=3045177 RepID=A0ABT6WJ42_9ACTN|nr:site-specific integrase [Actinoplanes sandaracinus]MDI6099747.1 site-specific integrase [Actinoplanes sandaracinus]